MDVDISDHDFFIVSITLTACRGAVFLELGLGLELKAAFNNISVISLRSVLLMEEAGVPRENHRHVASH